MRRVARPRLRQFVAFWLWARRYYARRPARQFVPTDDVHDLSRSATEAYLAGHARVSRCTRVGDVERLVAWLAAGAREPLNLRSNTGL
jgi:hypothetical protein